MGGVLATIVSWNDGTIVVSLPSNLASGSYNAVVTTGSGTQAAIANAVQVHSSGASVTTSLNIDNGYVSPSGQSYASSQSYFSLQANGTVKGSYYVIDPSTTVLAMGLSAQTTAAFTLYSKTFTIDAEGAHTVAYGSIDSYDNYEVLKSTSVRVDNTGPVASLYVNGVAADTTTVIGMTTASTMTITAIDYPSNGVSSGMNSILYLIDTPMSACGSSAMA